MQNTLKLPVAAIVVALLSGAVAAVSYLSRERGDVFYLSEIEIGLVAWALLLLMFGLQGVISVISEGRELRPGKAPPRLTDTLTGMIVIFSIILAALAVTLVIALVGNLSVVWLGTTAGLGAIVLSLLLIFYKEAFLGDEAHLDERDDGIPW